MLPKTLLTLSILLMGTWAQSTTEEASASATDASATATESSTKTSSGDGITTHTVNVGAAGHKFTPSEIEADVGDVIEWRFYPTQHWVIRADFNSPCIPYEYTETNGPGFSSGMQTVQAITNDGPRYRVRVNNTDPIFFYCGAPGSCYHYKMMGVINPTKNETLKEHLAKAEDLDFQLTPGQPFPTETDPGSKETGSSNSDEDNQSDNSSDSSSGHHKLSPGAIAGIAIGSAAVLLLAGGMIYLCGRRGGFDKAYRKSFRNSAAPMYNNVPPVAEHHTPSTAAGSVWTGQKQASPMSAYGQSPPMSPQHSGYGVQPGFSPMVAQDGTIGSYYSDQHAQHLAVPRHAESPRPHEQLAPAELPASGDPGNSPLPAYENTRHDHGEQPRTYSWAGEESAYRPTK